MHTIAFPGLGLGPFEIDRVAFTIFDKDIYWYGIIIALGFLMGIVIALRYAKRCNLTNDNIFDIVLVCAPVGIICARLYYVLFNLSDYESFSDVIAVWEGGLAIYGGIIGASLAAIVYCKVKKVHPMDMFDIGFMGIVTGQIIGRWGNFINAEAYGYETDSFVRMYIKGVGEVHPTFLYESLWNTALLCVLIYTVKNRKFKGQVFLTYVIGYGLGRFIIEGLRTDSLYIGDFRVSQLVALVSFVAGIIVYTIMMKKVAKKSRETS